MKYKNSEQRTQDYIKRFNRNSVLTSLIDSPEPIIFDVGANKGQSINRFKKINAKSLIHSFEPTPHLYKFLCDKFKHDQNIKLNNLGLADTNGVINFHCYKYSSINSPYPIDEKTKFFKARIITSKADKDNYEEIIRINVTSIDEYCSKNSIEEIDLVKIDTQGYEAKILEGMQNMLDKNKVSIIELELILGFAYKKNFSFYDYEKILGNKNYKLIAIETAGNCVSFSNYQTNLLYVNNEIFEKIRQMHEKNIDIPGVANRTDNYYPFSY